MLKKRLSQSREHGFTLVELLVSMAIIGVLVSLSAAAIQSAREIARRIQCRQRMSQLTLATHLFHDSHDALPPLEIADSWATWAVFILPDLEQPTLYSKWQLNRRYYAQTFDSGADLPVFHCPSRSTTSQSAVGTVGLFREGSKSGPPGWSDFGANAGTSAKRNNGTFASAIDISTNAPSAQPGSGPTQSVNTLHPGWKFSIGLKDHANDGLSQTIMFGEMHIPISRTVDSVFDGDNPSAYQRLLGHDGPFNSVSQRYLFEFPLVDKPSLADATWSNRFGSAHVGICNFSLADGSVRAFSVSTDLEVLDRLARRGDGNPVSLP